ncbi:AfsR/SARP family transcriptional regulator [Streptomyces tateyamensis]|uniref:AfsR/SARP family transcriptional regulator n=1 Tax=Streptomyces tateyamensis TaxID=565073 RepID=A0A2V4NEA7_9ACTN|nr:BTAD domain-containing putative transcriptional regulator [Streptomyces tateyamensis]PYC78544.1 AfsR/SARP family transcriptional regulator [Streptomyces tateyamensis]
MKFRILGPLELYQDGAEDTPLTPGAAKLRVVLGTLLARVNEVVSADRLIHELWGEVPPRTAATTLQVYVSHVRKFLDAADPGYGRRALLTRAPGYLMRLDPDQLDLTVFERLHHTGRAALAAEDYLQASELLHGALTLWRGELLAGTPLGPMLERIANRLGEQRTTALEQRFRADLQLGRHAELIPELQGAAAEHPLREELHGHLMTALYRAGRQGDALRAFTEVRRTLVRELAVEPGVPLRRLQSRILAADPELLLPEGVGPGAPAPVLRLPRQVVEALPPADPAFAGRAVELARLAELLAEARDHTGVLLTGACGVGKTALALAAAHAAAELFPDGRAYLDLHPGHPLSAEEALVRVLRLGGVPDPLPADQGALRALVAQLLRGRKLLLVLDHVAGAEQVQPLLDAGAIALVVARRAPAGLRGLAPLALGVVTGPDARELLQLPSGAPDATAIAEHCDHLPLALRAAGAALVARPHWTAGTLAERLRGERTRLATLRIGDPGLTDRLLTQYQEVGKELRSAFRTLGLLPAQPFELWAAAAALDLAPEEAELVLEALVHAHLLRPAGAGAGGHHDRYRLPALLRPLAVELLGAQQGQQAEPGGECSVLHRVCLAYAERAAEADELITPGRRSRPAAVTGLVGGRPLDWFARERRALTEVLRAAHAAGLWAVTEELAESLTGYLETCAAWEDWEKVQRLALDAAGHLADERGRAGALRSLADLAWQQGHLESAADLYQQARQAAARSGDQRQLGRILVGLGDVQLSLGEFGEAGELLDLALAVATEHEDTRGRYDALRALALLARSPGGGGPAEAERRLTECVELAHRLRDRRLDAYARRILRELRTEDAGPGLEVRPGVWRLAAGATG